MSTDLMEYILEAKRLGLDLNSLDLDALDQSIQTGEDLGYTTGVSDSAVNKAAEVEDVYGDNAYLVYRVPKTGNKELDHARLQNAINNSGGGLNDIVKGAAEASVQAESLLGSAPSPAPEEPPADPSVSQDIPSDDQAPVEIR